MKPTLIANMSSGTPSLMKTCIGSLTSLAFMTTLNPCLCTFLFVVRIDDGGMCGSLIGESLLKRPMVDTTSSCNITPYHLPPNFPMAHHHLVYPPPMGNGDMQGGGSNGSTSQCAVASVDSDVESPTEEGKE
ncbi:hypothetical protein RDI58_012855 [Solanum bulbocastanum]|uniref:Uncharacterized protein n=1 Tax=Solanum bulbocastanum TaxID=147425 RepID=A0AAN8YEQ3_SOLBU